jgi:hypothetical protein
MDNTGLSTSGIWLTPSRVKAITPKTITPIMIIQANTGFFIDVSDNDMFFL